MDAHKELDTRGLNCPLPILKAKKALAEMSSGDVLKVVATDPGSMRDFQAFARQTGNELLEQSQQDAEYTHYHPDHVGGEMGNNTIEGIAALLQRVDCPLHLQRTESEWVEKPPRETAELTWANASNGVIAGSRPLTPTAVSATTPTAVRPT